MICHAVCAILSIQWQRCCDQLLDDKLHVKYFFYRLHAVSRKQQGGQKESSVKTLRSSLSAEFWKHYVLSSGTQRRSLPRHQSEEIEILI